MMKMDDERYRELKAGMDPSVVFKRPYWLYPELKIDDNRNIMCPMCKDFPPFLMRMNIDEGTGPWVCKKCAIKYTIRETGSPIWKMYKTSYERESEKDKNDK